MDCGNCNSTFDCINGVCELNATEFVKSIGAISWLRFEGNALDEIGENDGIVHGATLVGGKFGQAYEFDGDHIEISDNLDFNDFNTAFSVSAWARPTSWDSSHNTIVGQESGFLLAINSLGNLANWINAGGGWTIDSSQPAISLNIWTHFTMTYDGVKIRSYINGVLQGSGQSKTGDMGTENLVYIGKRDSGTYQPFHGLIDEPMIFNRALSDSEIQQLYNLS